MSNLLVLLVLCMTTFLSSLFSPASGDDELELFSITGWWGINELPIHDGVTSGVVFDVPIHTGELPLLMPVCIAKGPPCPAKVGSLPLGTHLSSKNRAVASVKGAIITLMGFGATTLELRQDEDDILVASFPLVIFAPSRPGQSCVGLGRRDNPPEVTDAIAGITDCSGKCVRFDDIAGLSAEVCCMAQFGDAPGFEFCPDLTPNLPRGSFCSFNATTGKEDKHAYLGTCNDMCQRFGSQCVGALHNEMPGCTYTPSRDTCKTPLQTAICFCERL